MKNNDQKSIIIPRLLDSIEIEESNTKEQKPILRMDFCFFCPFGFLVNGFLGNMSHLNPFF